MLILNAARTLRDEVDSLRFKEPVHAVYNPLDYAWAGFENYCQAFGLGHKKVLFMGMNPGPWGMAQTGVPFGEIRYVCDWMNLFADIKKPEPEHPKRPIEGFHCKRSEVSGKRLWGLFSERYGTADAFFHDHFVFNYCPLIFMSETGANITPDKLPKAEAAPLMASCDKHLIAVVEAMNPQWVVGIGAYAEKCIKRVLGDSVAVGKVLHPSPASPAANRGWAEAAQKQLVAQEIWPSY